MLEAATGIVGVARRVGRVAGTARLRIHIDARDGIKPGAKYYEWELRGIPLRLELGPRDLAANQGVLVRRDTREKRPVSLDTIGEDVADTLSLIQRDMLAAALDRREANSVRERDLVRSLPRADGRAGRLRVRGLVRRRRVRGGDQGRDEGDDPLPSRRGVPLGRGADDAASSADAPSTVEALWAKAY